MVGQPKDSGRLTGDKPRFMIRAVGSDLVVLNRHRCWRWLIPLIISGGIGQAHAASLERMATVRVQLMASPGLSWHPLVKLISIDKTALTLIAQIREPADLAIIRRVPAGRYRLEVSAPGFREALIDVEVRPATSYEFQALLADTTQPSAQSRLQLVRTRPMANAQLFDQRLLETFPGEDVLWSIVETAAAPLIVDQISDGGLRVGEAALVGGPASSWRETSIALGPLDVTDPARPGTPLIRTNHAPTEGLIVWTSMLPVSEAGPGPVLTLVPKAAATVWHSGAMIGAFPSGLQSENAQPGVPSIARLAMHRDLSAELGGPLGPRTGLFVSSQLASAERFERDEAAPLHTSVGSVSANVVTTGSQGRLQIAGTFDRAGSPYAGRARFTNRDVRETDTFTTMQATVDRWTTGGTVWSASAGFAQGLFDPAVDQLGSSSVATVERLSDGSIPTLFDLFPGTHRRFSAQVDVEPGAAILGPRHSFTAGARAGRNTAVTRAVPSPAVAELVGGIPARVWDYGYIGPEARWTSTELAGYIADAITLPARLRVDAGVRIDMSRGAARDAANAISWVSAAPRVSLRWQADTKGWFALLGGYSRYSHPLPLDYFAYGDPAAAAGRVYRWNDNNGDRVFQDGERGILIAAVGPCCAGGVPNRIDSRIKRPLTDELLAAVEGRVGPWFVRLSAIDRRGRHFVHSVDSVVQKGATSSSTSLTSARISWRHPTTAFFPSMTAIPPALVRTDTSSQTQAAKTRGTRESN
jgi:hypothetical protein